MSVFLFSSRRSCLALRTRAAGALTASLSASLLALAFAAPALAADTVALGDAEAYSVLAGTAVTSNGATAMSENLGASTLAGDGFQIVLGETHLADQAVEDAHDGLDAAYGDASLRPSVGMGTADFGTPGLQPYTPGVYGTSGAMGFTAGGTLTLDGQDDENAVFIFQIGGALGIGANTTVALINGAQACNVFWTVGTATTIGADSVFVGTMMATGAITMGATSRVDGRLLSRTAAITLPATRIHTAGCATPPPVVVGPPGPAGADGNDGATGAAGADGNDGATGPAGAAGAAGADGADGSAGSAGSAGDDGLIGLTGLTGLMGATGLTGANGVTGPTGADGNDGATGAAGSAGADGADGDDGLIGLTGLTGLMGATGLTGANGVTGPTGADGNDGATGAAGSAGDDGDNGLNGLTGLTGLMGAPGLIGADGRMGRTGPPGPAGVSPVADTTALCVTNRAGVRKVRQGGLVRWTIVVKNCGDRAASGVWVTDHLRKGASVKTRGGATLVRRSLKWKTGTLAPGARKIYKITTRFSPNARPGRYINRATADGDNTQPSTGQGSTTVKSGL